MAFDKEGAVVLAVIATGTANADVVSSVTFPA